VSSEPIEPKPVAQMGVTEEFNALTSSVVLAGWKTGPLVEAELQFEDLKLRPAGMLQRAGKNSAEVWVTATNLAVVVKRADRVARIPGVEIDPERELRNEAAAYRVAEALGWTDLVPPTVYRRVPTTTGWVPASVQLFVPGAHHDDLFGADEEQTRRAAIFDYVIGAKDRLPRNWMFVKTSGIKKFVLIDNGWSFSYPRARPPRSAIWNTYGYKAHSLEPGGLRVPENAVAEVRSRLYGLISSAEIEDVIVRMRLFTSA